MLHYLQDWTAPLSELRRVLKPGGRLLLSVNHPRILESSDPSADYFSVTQYSDEYTFADGQRAVLNLPSCPTPRPSSSRPGSATDRLHLLHLLRPGRTLMLEAPS